MQAEESSRYSPAAHWAAANPALPRTSSAALHKDGGEEGVQRGCKGLFIHVFFHPHHKTERMVGQGGSSIRNGVLPSLAAQAGAVDCETS